MTFSDFITPPAGLETEKWQIGSMISHQLVSGGVAILFVPEYRGANINVEVSNINVFRKCFYGLSRQDFSLPIADLGELILGKTLADTQYILQEIGVSCLQKGVLPIIIGGSNDLSYSLVSAVNFSQNNISYTQISPQISLYSDGDEVIERNYFSKILNNKELSVSEFNLLGYQKHLNPLEVVSLMNEMGFHHLRLAEIMNSTERAEPFFRRADLVTLNCDAVESFADGFSIYPQVNGLNRREICSCMREVGLSENLKSLGIFNFNIASKNLLNHQLLAQMLWYFLEGLHIQRTHPKERTYESFRVMLGDDDLVFQRDTFSGLWYFGSDKDIKNCTPCTREDYENAKKGILNKRLK